MDLSPLTLIYRDCGNIYMADNGKVYVAYNTPADVSIARTGIHIAAPKILHTCYRLWESTQRLRVTTDSKHDGFTW
jgi:hypothetical protein